MRHLIQHTNKLLEEEAEYYIHFNTGLESHSN